MMGFQIEVTGDYLEVRGCVDEADAPLLRAMLYQALLHRPSLALFAADEEAARLVEAVVEWSARPGWAQRW